MNLATVECPKCNQLHLFLWCREAEAFCDDCASRLGSTTLTEIKSFKLLIAPWQSTSGNWYQQEHIDFGVLRQHIETGLRVHTSPRANSVHFAKTPRAFQSLIDVLESLIPGPTRLQIDEKLEQIGSELEKLRKSLSQEENILKGMSNPSRKATRQKLIKEIRDNIMVLERQKAIASGESDLVRIRRHSVQRLRHDFELWQRGALEIQYDVPIRRVYWELLKPNGNS